MRIERVLPGLHVREAELLASGEVGEEDVRRSDREAGLIGLRVIDVLVRRDEALVEREVRLRAGEADLGGDRSPDRHAAAGGGLRRDEPDAVANLLLAVAETRRRDL